MILPMENNAVQLNLIYTPKRNQKKYIYACLKQGLFNMCMWLNGFSHFYLSIGTFNLTSTTTQRFTFGGLELSCKQLKF